MSYYYGNYCGGLGYGLGGFGSLGYGYGSGYGLGGFGGYGCGWILKGNEAHVLWFTTPTLREYKSPGTGGDIHSQETHLQHQTKSLGTDTMSYYYGNYCGGLGYGLGGFGGLGYGYGSIYGLGGYGYGCGCFRPFYRRYWSSGFY
ncbi:keratin-associated protein 19-4-like [Vulpes lagopus]|uniref:keratin-associated protein 19-4-like n=1 Tax=Vulpes lagopus TaxID=494514 RepID=UPI001BCA0674|nr:keratin-associated protein 19-4-like [Vulpes lagopus]